MRISAGVATDTGRVRDHNEDAFIVEPPLYAIADGMGGANAGEVASQLALETIGEMQRTGTGTLDDEVREANRVVFERAGEDTKLAGMGTTVTAALASAEALHLAHVGDSRAYLRRAGSLRKLTNDHTLVDRMVQAGEISRDEADVHPHRNVLIRALGTEPKVDVEAMDLGLLEGDQVLICSDGLTDMVTENQITAILDIAQGAPQDAADRLVRAANRAGGIDNITAIVLEVQPGEPEAGTVAPAPAATESTARRVPWRAITVVLTTIVLLMVAYTVLRSYLDRQWYLGVSNGHVALYPGHPGGAVRHPPVARRPRHGDRRRDRRAAAELSGPRGGDHLRQPRRGDADRRPDAGRPPDTAAAASPASERRREWRRMSAVATPAAVRKIRTRTGLTATIVAIVASVLAYALQGLGLAGTTPANLVAYGVTFAVLALGGWYAVRKLARDADPVLYPTAVLLGGLGLAMLYRLMTARDHPEFATEQAVWLAIALAVLIGTLVFIRDIRQLDAYTYTIGLAGLVLLLLPIVPGVGTEVNGARLWVNLGFVTFQPAEPGRILIVIFLASYLGQRRELLATGVGRFGLPRVKDLGPIAARMERLADRPVPRARHGRVAAAVRRVHRDALGRDRPVGLPGARDRLVRDRRVHRLPRVLARAGARRRVAARDGPQQGRRRGLPAVAGMVRVRHRAGWSAPASASARRR